MLIKGLVLINILGWMFILGCLSKKNIITLLSSAVSIEVFVYVVVSGVLFLLNSFSIQRALWIITIGIVTFSCIVIIKRKRFQIDKEWKSMIIPFIILLVAYPFAYKQFGFFGMGQDQGVYQTNALILYNGGISNRLDLEEYHLLEDENAKSEYVTMIRSFTGYYTWGDYPTFSSENQHCAADGFLHGVPTCAAVYALSSSLFGLSEMMRINSLIYLCIIWLLYYTCVNLKFSRTSSAIVTGLMAMSPIILWVSKSALTEIVLVLTVVSFIYYLSENTKEGRWLAIVPIACFAFYHVSCFIYMPLFLGVYYLEYLRTKERDFLIIALITSFILIPGFVMMLIVAPQYTYNNCSSMLIGGLSNEYLVFYPVVLFAITILLSVFFLKSGSLNWKKVKQSGWFLWSIRILFLLIIIRYFVYGFVLAKGVLPRTEYASILSVRYFGQGIIAYEYTSFAALIYFTGVLIIPLALIYIMWKPEIFLERNYLLIAYPFAYFLLVFAVFKVEIFQYYYFARYLAFSIPIVLVFSGIIINHIKTKFAIPIGICAIVCMLPFSLTLAIERDDTIIDWGTLENMAVNIEPNSAVVYEDVGIAKTIALAMRSMTNSGMYPISENSNEQLEWLQERYNNVYYVTADSVDETDCTIVYQNEYTESQDDLNGRSFFCPLPVDMYKNQHEITVYTKEE